MTPKANYLNRRNLHILLIWMFGIAVATTWSTGLLHSIGCAIIGLGSGGIYWGSIR